MSSVAIASKTSHISDLKGSLSCNFWQARVRLAAGEWSNKFSLDAAGSGGDLKVKKGGKLHEVSEQCQQLLIFSMKSVHI